MFTGLIQHVGSVVALQAIPQGCRLEIDAGAWEHRPALGDSISVSGCCLTVAQLGTEGGANRFVFEAVPETMAKTTLGDLEPDHPVNLEHALTPTSLLGGHFVQGHVDGVGRVVGVQSDPADWRIRVLATHDVEPYLVPKGSIAIDGVSLTIADLTSEWLEVALIPTTLELTTLDRLQSGSRVNLEADVLAKTVVHTMERFGAGLPR